MTMIRYTARVRATRTRDGWVVEMDTGFDPVSRLVRSRLRSRVRDVARELAGQAFGVPADRVALDLEWVK